MASWEAGLIESLPASYRRVVISGKRHPLGLPTDDANNELVPRIRAEVHESRHSGLLRRGRDC